MTVLIIKKASITEMNAYVFLKSIDNTEYFWMLRFIFFFEFVHPYIGNFDEDVIDH